MLHYARIFCDIFMKKGDIIDLSIDSIAFGGEGVGKYPYEKRLFTVFVRGVVPKDRVRVKITGKKRNYARALVVDFLEKAENRIMPRCRHFLSCGGCSLQNLAYKDQLKIKEQQVKDALKRIGGLNEGIVLPIIGCENEWFYRNKMEFGFDFKDDGLHLGLHPKRRFHDVVDIEECFLFDFPVPDLIQKMRHFFKDFPDESLKSLILRRGINTGETMIALVTENMGAGSEIAKKFANFVRKFGFKSAYHINNINRQGLKKTAKEALLCGNPTIREALKLKNGAELQFEISPQSFFQPNTIQAQNLYSIALEYANLSGKEIVYDLYCGTGTIGLCASFGAKKVYGVEINETAVQNARANARLNCISNVEFLAGDCAQMTAKIKDPPHVVIVDPPRNGFHGKVFPVIADLGARRIVYISCNPTTLARDLNLFTKTGYKAELVQPVDMFPQTCHIESVAVLSK
jgi:23S rRNA (uracil1939-C5)-methyltransferase